MSEPRRPRIRSLALAAALLAPPLWLAACEEKSPPTQYVGKEAAAPPPAKSPSTTAPAAAPVPDAAKPTHPPAAATLPAVNGKSLAGLRISVPTSWTERPPANTMRVAEFAAPPAVPGEDPVDVVVSHFGTGGAGSVTDNLLRWAGQVVTELGAPVEPRADNFLSGSLIVTLTESTGTYQSGMPGQPAQPKPGWTLIGAVVEGSEQGPVYFKMTGPAAAVAAQRDALMGMLRTVQRAK